MNKQSAETNNTPLVSVVMPLFNAELTIKTSIESVLNQTYRNLELLIVDDCSTDDGYGVAKSLAAHDNRVKLIQLANNSGAGIARNTAIDAAKGDYIAFLDADDKWAPNKLEKQLLIFDTHDVALVCSGYTVVDNNYNITGRKQPEEWIAYSDLLKSNKIGCLTAIYSVTRVGKAYMPTIRKRQDYALWLNITRSHGPAYCIQDVLSEYYVQPGSISSNKLEMLKWNYRMFRHSQNFPPLKALIMTIRNAAYKILKG